MVVVVDEGDKALCLSLEEEREDDGSCGGGGGGNGLGKTNRDVLLLT